MSMLVSNTFTAFQTQFHQRWNHLNDPHVRALAWLLDAPNLLDARAPQWQDKIATYVDPDLMSWLSILDSDSRQLQELHKLMTDLPSNRLGLYAEKLMAFYFQQKNQLVAHSVQIRANKNTTIGEFDFLLQQGDVLVHWEFATKFYLLRNSDDALQVDDFLGPNLADSLGEKMRKILYHQLALSQHPAAQSYLPQQVTSTQAFIKGWLFYQQEQTWFPQGLGVSATHCRGYWCALSDLQLDHEARYILLPRLRWLAPAKVMLSASLDAVDVRQALLQHVKQEHSPMLLVTLALTASDGLEICRGFVVPDDWSSRAVKRRQLATTRVV